MAISEAQQITIARLLGRMWNDPDLEQHLAGLSEAAETAVESLLTRIAAAEAADDEGGLRGYLEQVEDIKFRDNDTLTKTAVSGLVTQLAALIGVHATGLATATSAQGRIWRG